MSSIPGRFFRLSFSLGLAGGLSIACVHAQNSNTPSSPLILRGPTASQMYQSLGLGNTLGPVQVKNQSSKTKQKLSPDGDAPACGSEEQESIEQCEEAGGIYDLDTCACNFPEGGGGGGSEHPKS